jgi:DNA-directed RNA polymerase specialized sigma24 family protein
MKMDRKTIDRHYKLYFGIALKKCGEKGFRGEDRLEAAEDVFVALANVDWPSPRNEKAWFARFAENIAFSMQRKLLAQKRKPKELAEDEKSSGPQFIPIGEANLVADVDLDAAVDTSRVQRAVRTLVNMLPPQHRTLMLARLDDDPDSLFDRFGKGKSQEALRALRRLAGIPAVSPARADIKDHAEHLILAARTLEMSRAAAGSHAESVQKKPEATSASTSKETPCECESSITTSARAASVSEHRTPATLPSGRALPNRAKTLSGAPVALKRTSASAHTSSSRSLPPSNGSERSPRPEFWPRTSGASPKPATQKATSNDAPPRETSIPIPADLASAPTLIRSKGPLEATSTEREPLVEDEPSFSGGTR